MNEWQENCKQLVHSFQELLECPVCFGTMDSTLIQCPWGHGVCNFCARKIKRCPTCKRPLVFAFHRNTLLEQILENIPKPCPYTDKGCNTVMFDEEHQDYCEYRPSECKKKSCNWKGCVKDLVDHIRKCTKGRVVSEVSLNEEVERVYNFGFFETKDDFTPILCQKQLFWVYFHRDAATKSIYHKLYHIPTTKQSGTFYMVVSFNKGDIGFKHTCEASTDIDNHNKDNASINGLIIPNAMLNKLKWMTNSYEYTVKLVKEE